MNHRTLNVFAVLVIAGLLVAPAAFSQADRLKADIPFEFIVGNKTLPAGTYQVHCGTNNLVTLQSVDQNTAVGVLSQPGYAVKAPVTGKLIFTRYDNSYFLAQVWRPGVNSGSLMPKSKMEREAATRVARPGATEIALQRDSR